MGSCVSSNQKVYALPEHVEACGTTVDSPNAALERNQGIVKPTPLRIPTFTSDSFKSANAALRMASPNTDMSDDSYERAEAVAAESEISTIHRGSFVSSGGFSTSVLVSRSKPDPDLDVTNDYVPAYDIPQLRDLLRSRSSFEGLDFAN